MMREMSMEDLLSCDVSEIDFFFCEYGTSSETSTKSDGKRVYQ